MKYLLDTNVCIRFLNQRSQVLTKRFHETNEIEIIVCSVVRAELYTGALKSNNPEKTLNSQKIFTERFVSLPFDDAAADAYAGIRAKLESMGKPIGGNDMLIAAIALASNLVLVTHNVREFERVENLKIEDWET